VSLTCERLRELLFDHHAGELEVEHQESFQVHLDGCENCTNYVASYTHTVKITRKLPRCTKLPADVEARLREVLKDHLGGQAKAN
jgi:hypothetical protein